MSKFSDFINRVGHKVSSKFSKWAVTTTVYALIWDPSVRVHEIKKTTDLKHWNTSYWNKLSFLQRLFYVVSELGVKDPDIKDLLIMSYADFIGKRIATPGAGKTLFDVNIHELQTEYFELMEHQIREFNAKRWQMLTPNPPVNDKFENKRIIEKLRTNVLRHLKSADMLERYAEINREVKKILYELIKNYVEEYAPALTQQFEAQGKPIKQKFDYIRTSIRSDPHFPALINATFNSLFYQSTYFETLVKVYDDDTRP